MFLKAQYPLRRIKRRAQMGVVLSTTYSTLESLKTDRNGGL